jgi:hypothetical protein
MVVAVLRGRANISSDDLRGMLAGTFRLEKFEIEIGNISPPYPHN